MIITKILSIALISCILILILRKESPAFATLLSIACSILIFFLIANDLSILINNFKNIIESFNFKTQYLNILFKIIAISYLTEFAMQICNDSGENAIASKISLSSKIIIISISLPIFNDLLDIINFLF